MKDNMNYGQWLDIWLETCVRPSVKLRTYQGYADTVRRYIRDEFGALPLSGITPLVVQAYVGQLLSHGNRKTGGGLSVSTVQLVITVIQNSMKYAALYGKVAAGAAFYIRRPCRADVREDAFSRAEQRKMERAALSDGAFDTMFGVVLCLYTGLRIGELLALTWGDIDFVRGTLTVDKTVHEGRDESGRYARIVSAPKSRSSARTVPLPKQILPVLRARRKRDPAAAVVEKDGHPVTVRSYQRRFSTFLQKLGIPHRRFHMLRHTFATRALECGMDVRTLADILGHKSPAVTLERYAHSTAEHKRTMADKVGKLFT